jgi:hypothetical protein
MTGKILALTIAGVLAVIGVGTALADLGSSDDSADSAQAIELRKDDADADAELVDEDDEGDVDGTRGDDGTSGGNNTPVEASVDDRYVAPAPAPAAAPAPVYSDDGGYSD